MAKTYGPLLEIARIQTEINKLFESLFELKTKKDYKESLWIPSVDICECEEYVKVKVEIPMEDGRQSKTSIQRSNP